MKIDTENPPADILEEINTELAHEPEFISPFISTERTKLTPEQLLVRQRMAVISLFKAVAAQAVDDYKALQAAKIVRHGKLIKPWRTTKVGDGDYIHESSVKQLLLWLGGDGLEECLDACHERMHPDFIRRHIGFTA